jgi:hypothetical protein
MGFDGLREFWPEIARKLRALPRQTRVGAPGFGSWYEVGPCGTTFRALAEVLKWTRTQSEFFRHLISGSTVAAGSLRLTSSYSSVLRDCRSGIAPRNRRGHQVLGRALPPHAGRSRFPSKLAHLDERGYALGPAFRLPCAHRPRTAWNPFLARYATPQ